MRSRYYIDDDTLDEVSGLLMGRKRSGLKWTAGDVHPGETAPIIMRRNVGIWLDEMKWGFLQYSGKGLFINARAETALQKKTFSESVLHRRCVILTTQANSSVSPVHDRMPLILEKENVEDWICDGEQTQAIELGKRLAAERLPVDEILYSPLVRASETARHISEETGIPMRMEPRLKEQNFGRYESTPRDGREFQIAKTHFLDHYDGGETMMQLCQRVYNLIDDIRADDRTYLLVAHNGISRVVQSYFYDMTNEEFAAFGIGNCEVRTYTW